MNTDQGAAPVSAEPEDYFDDSDEPFRPVCRNCLGEGMDPWNDYILPCPECDGEPSL